MTEPTDNDAINETATGESHSEPTDLERALEGLFGESGEQIDIAEAALLFAALDRPRVGLARYREQLTEMIELPRSVHPWFLGVQFHPEFKSTPWDGHPLFNAFISAALEHQGSGRPLKVAA